MRIDPPKGVEAVVEGALRAQFEALSTIFDALNLVVYVADLDSHELLFVNAYTQQVFGGEWAGRRCYQYLQSGQADPCTFCTNQHLVQDGKARPPHVWEFQNTVNRRWYLCIDRAIPWIDGRLVRLEAAVDITERKEAEQFRQQYVGLVSHDLRNPLNAIVLSAKQLELTLKESEHARELSVVGRILQSSKRIDTMIRDLLDCMKLESADVVLRREPVDIGALVQGLVELVPREQRDRLALRLPHDRPCTLADPVQIERVVDNLISNALKYSDPPEPVEVEVVCRPLELAISVSDHGVGIAEPHIRRLFDRFYRVPGTVAEGLGLGLYIARLIVQRHGGRFEVESEPGRGSRFQFTLPLEATEG
jgi:two-component system, OmpR family, phosphate regulon sensor histidine kinase PhoR